MPLKEQDLETVIESLFDQVLVIGRNFIIEHANRSTPKSGSRRRSCAATVSWSLRDGTKHWISWPAVSGN